MSSAVQVHFGCTVPTQVHFLAHISYNIHFHKGMGNHHHSLRSVCRDNTLFLLLVLCLLLSQSSKLKYVCIIPRQGQSSMQSENCRIQSDEQWGSSSHVVRQSMWSTSQSYSHMASSSVDSHFGFGPRWSLLWDVPIVSGIMNRIFLSWLLRNLLYKAVEHGNGNKCGYELITWVEKPWPINR